MHQYCWCEKDDCEWCRGCTCPDEAWRYFKDKQEIASKQYNDEFYDYEGKLPCEYAKFGSKKYKEYDKKWNEKIAERNKRYDVEHTPMCDYCKGLVGNAPNFWHKKSNFKVWWYKWIGRDSKYSRELTLKEWTDIFNDCIGIRSGG